MAKALFGHVAHSGIADARTTALSAEVRRLRARVLELEVQLEQACRANEELHLSLPPVIGSDDLHSADLHSELLALDEPAYT